MSELLVFSRYAVNLIGPYYYVPMAPTDRTAARFVDSTSEIPAHLHTARSQVLLGAQIVGPPPPPPRMSPTTVLNRDHFYDPGRASYLLGAQITGPVPPPDPRVVSIFINSVPVPHQFFEGKVTKLAGYLFHIPVIPMKRDVAVTLSPGPRPHTGFVQWNRGGLLAVVRSRFIVSSPQYNPTWKAPGGVTQWIIPKNAWPRPIPGIVSLAPIQNANRDGFVIWPFLPDVRTIPPKPSPLGMFGAPLDRRTIGDGKAEISFSVTKVVQLNLGSARPIVVSTLENRTVHGSNVYFTRGSKSFVAPTTVKPALIVKAEFPLHRLNGFVRIALPAKVPMIKVVQPPIIVLAKNPTPIGQVTYIAKKPFIFERVVGRKITVVGDPNAFKRWSVGRVIQPNWITDNSVAPYPADHFYCVDEMSGRWSIGMVGSSWYVGFATSRWDVEEVSK